MIFKRQKNQVTKEVIDFIPKPASNILWLEISVGNLYRAVNFYEKLLKTSFEIRTLFDKPMALFNSHDLGIGGSLVEVENYHGSDGIKPVIYVGLIHEAIKVVKINGGRVINEPSIVKQKNQKGETVIGTNLFDNKLGYIAEIEDCEGNCLYLYSNS
jgi:predicted enzyme related to lactoylglutathione lyase